MDNPRKINGLYQPLFRATVALLVRHTMHRIHLFPIPNDPLSRCHPVIRFYSFF